MALQKVREFTGLTKAAPEAIEKHEMEAALRSAEFTRDAHLFDLEAEFRAREAKIRQQFLDDVREIMKGE
jgi:hypothetical protein